MKYLIWILGLLVIATLLYSEMNINRPYSTLEELDGAPSNRYPLIKVPNGILQDNTTFFTLLLSSVTPANLPNDSTSYIQNRDTLQSGTTFFVSSGTANFMTVPSTITVDTIKARIVHASTLTGNSPLVLDSVLKIVFNDGSVQITSASGGGGAGDNLGNHTATQNLDMNRNAIINVGSMTSYGTISSTSGFIGDGSGLRNLSTSTLANLTDVSNSTSDKATISFVNTSTSDKAAISFVNTSSGNKAIALDVANSTFGIQKQLENIVSTNIAPNTIVGDDVSLGAILRISSVNAGTVFSSNPYQGSAVLMSNTIGLDDNGTVRGFARAIKVTGAGNGGVSITGDTATITMLDTTGSGGGGDNLGSHIATQTLSMNSYGIVGSTSMKINSMDIFVSSFNRLSLEGYVMMIATMSVPASGTITITTTTLDVNELYFPTCTEFNGLQKAQAQVVVDNVIIPNSFRLWNANVGNASDAICHIPVKPK